MSGHGKIGCLDNLAVMPSWTWQLDHCGTTIDDYSKIFSGVILSVAVFLYLRPTSPVGLGLADLAPWLLILAVALFISSMIGISAITNQSSIITRLVKAWTITVFSIHSSLLSLYPTNLSSASTSCSIVRRVRKDSSPNGHHWRMVRNMESKSR